MLASNPMMGLALSRFRRSTAALLLAVLAWSSGCAVRQPMVEPTFAARSFTPARIALLPPAIFMTFDEVGDNDPKKSDALRQQVTTEAMRLIIAELTRRGYDVDTRARYDGVFGKNGEILVGPGELSWLSNAVLDFANSPQGGPEGRLQPPAFVAPDLARKVGWATQSDTLLYLNIKGVVVSKGKVTAQVLAGAAIVAFVVLMYLLMSQGSRGGGSRSRSSPAGGGAAAAPSTGAVAPIAGSPTNAFVAPRGRGSMGGGGGGRTYGRSHSGPSFGVGVGVMVPLDGPSHTHQGRVVQDEDEAFSGDDLYVSMTMVSATDGRVLWHIRENVDVEADQTLEMQRLFRRYGDAIPPSLGHPGR